MGITTTAEQLYTAGTYLERNALWHTEESLWKAEEVMRMLNRQAIAPRTICEVGCGAGEVLKQLQQRLNNDCDLLGCDVSPQAIELCRSRLMRSFISFLWNIKEQRSTKS
jgi:ubiquinone/menaquinone biosynthesis C-methylase UbiE